MAFLLTAFLTGCGQPGDTAGRAGELALVMAWPDPAGLRIQAIPLQTASIRLTVTGDQIPADAPLIQTLTRQPGQAVARLRLTVPAGAKRVTGEALGADGQLLARAQSLVEIQAGKKHQVELDLLAVPVLLPEPVVTPESTPLQQEVIFFGPKTFVRTAGPSDTYIEPFVLLPGTYLVRIVNGTADGQQRVSSARVSLNGQELAGPNDFSPQVAFLEKSLPFEDGQASQVLQVDLNSAPGSFLTVMIVRLVMLKASQTPLPVASAEPLPSAGPSLPLPGPTATAFPSSSPTPTASPVALPSPTPTPAATAPPAITGFSPGSGSPGTTVTFSGSGFASVSAVRFNGTAAVFTIASDSSLLATVPAGATTGSVSLTNPAGSSASATFTVTAAVVPPPTLNAPAPANGAIGDTITLTGSNFAATAAGNTVRFGTVAVPAGDINVVSATQLTAKVPAGVKGTVPVTVEVGGQTSGAQNFAVTPSITSLSAANGAISASIQINGTGFSAVAAEQTVRFGGVTAAIAAASATQLTVTVPAGISGSAPVTVQLGTQTSNSAAFSVNPVITSLSIGTAQVGASIQVNGSGFSPLPASNTVRFNAVGAAVTAASPTQLTVTVPGGVLGAVNVSVQVGTQTSNNQGITVTSTTITGFTPSVGPAGTNVVITGTDFTGATNVTFNGAAAAFAVNSATQITATAPAGVTTGALQVTAPGGNPLSPFAFMIPQGGSFNITTGVNNGYTLTYNSTANEYLALWSRVTSPCCVLNLAQIFAQRVSPAGTLAGGEITVTTPSRFNQQVPVVAYNPTASEYMVAYVDERSGNFDIYSQRINAAGATVGAETTIASGAQFQAGHQIAFSTAANEYLVVWHENNDILGQRLSSTGTLIGGNFPVANAAATQLFPLITYNPTSSEYLAIWQDSRNGSTDIFAQRISSAGALIGGDFSLTPGTNGSNQLPVYNGIAYNNNLNEYLVSFTDQRNGPNDCYAQRVSASGALVGGNIQVTTNGSRQDGGKVAYNPSAREYLLVWPDFRVDAFGDTYAQRMGEDGTMLGGNFIVMAGGGIEQPSGVAYSPLSSQYLVTFGVGLTLTGQRYSAP